MDNLVFKLVSNCLPVKGAENSLICDLHRLSFDLIPNDLYEILIQHEGKTIKAIKFFYENKYDDIIQDYFDFLLEKEYIFFTDTPDWFPKLNLKYHYPFEISNAIIDIDEFSNFDINKILTQLDELNCKFLEIRFYKKVNNEEILDIITYLNNIESIVQSVGIIIPFNENLNIDKLLKSQPRISYIYNYNAPHDEFINPIRGKSGYIINSTKSISNCTDCGKIKSSYFISNIKNFTESLHHNSCLHKKISIDKEGEIRNCPSMSKSYGNISDTSLEEALNKPGFKKYWNLTKDKIEVCKDCEFRYICTDCRAYTERTHTNKKGLDTSKPLKCGYNPYTGEWAEWSTNPLKQKAIEFYGLQDLVK